MFMHAPDSIDAQMQQVAFRAMVEMFVVGPIDASVTYWNLVAKDVRDGHLALIEAQRMTYAIMFPWLR